MVIEQKLCQSCLLVVNLLVDWVWVALVFNSIGPKA